MVATRRQALTLLTGGGVAATLAACSGRVNRRSKPTPGSLDIERLNRDFAGLAARAAPGRLNLGVLWLKDDRVWSADSDARLPLADAAMPVIAAAALAEVDAGRMTLGEPIRIDDTHLSAPPSLIGQRFAGAMTLPAVDLVALAVQHGDNTAADVILSRIGGPGAVSAWLQGKGVEGVSLDRYAREIATDLAGLASFRAPWATEAGFVQARDQIPPGAREAAAQAYLRDPRDTATLPGVLSFLDRLVDGRLLSSASTRLLLRLMTASSGGGARLAAALPPSAAIAGHAGGSPTDLGFTPVTCDLGVVTLSGGAKVAVCAVLTGSTATAPERDRLIADAGRLALASAG